MSEPQRIVVLGAGAMGSWVGAHLAEAGHDVTLVGRARHVAAVNATGLRVSGKTTLQAHPRAVRRATEAATPDLLLVTTKAYDTARALDSALPIIGQRTRVLSLQNGLGNHEVLAREVPERNVLLGVTSHGVTYVEPGHVRHAGVGYSRVGSPSGEHDTARWAANLLTDAGIETEVTEQVLGEVWAKVVVNVGINPITAITGLPNGALLELGHLRELMQRACEEAIEVAKAEGVQLPPDDLVIRAMKVAELTAENKSSMLQDVERGKRTEVDAICGEIVRRGLARGVDTPVNLSLSALVRGIEHATVRD